MNEITEQEAIDCVASLLKVPVADLTTTKIENNEGIYVYQPVRGGSAIIVANDKSVLFANSSIAFEEHLEAFKSGKRTNIDLFS